MENTDIYGIIYLEHEGENIYIDDIDIIKNADHHAARFTSEDGRVFEVPIQGYHELSGSCWTLEWDHIIEL